MFEEVKTLIKHSSVYGSANLLQKGIGFIMIPIYTRYLSPADYGILELMDLTINVITMLIGMRLGSAIIRYYHHYDDSRDKLEVFTTALIFVFSLSLIIVSFLECFTRPIAGLVLGQMNYYHYFQILFVSMGLQTIATVPENRLLVEKRSVVFSAVSIGTLISYLTFNILFLVVFKLGVLGILLSMLITKILNISSLLIITLRRIKLTFSLEKLKNMMSFGLPLVPAALCLFIMHFSDRFFIQKFCNLNELGLYSLGYKFGMILSVIVSEPIFRVWNTQRFEIAKEADAEQVFGRIFTYYSAVVIFAALGISIFIDETLSVMAASSYQGAATIVPLVVLSYVFFGMSNFFNLGIMIAYKTKYIAYVQLIVAALNLLLNFLLISHYGIMGAALSTLLSFLCLALLSFIVSQRLYPVPFEYGRVFALLGVATVIFTFSRLISPPFLISLGFKSVLMILFPAILFFGRFFYDEEIKKAKELLRDITCRFDIRKRPDKIAGMVKR